MRRPHLLAVVAVLNLVAAAAFYHRATVAEQQVTVLTRKYVCSVEASLAKTIAQARDSGMTRAELPISPREARIADWVYSQKVPPSATPALWEERCLS